MPRRKKIESTGEPVHQFESAPLAPPSESPTITPMEQQITPQSATAPKIPKPRRRRVAPRNLKTELKQIYANDDGQPLDMSFFQKKSRRTRKKVLFSILLGLAFLAGTAWLGFFIFNPGQKFSEENIKLTVETPEKISAGSTVTLKINYQNNQNTPLGEANLTVRYPQGFKVSKVEPAAFNKENTEWDLGTLTKDKPGVISITGQITGSKNVEWPLRLFLNYKPANFNAEFQKILTQNLQVQALPLETSFSGPDDLEAGQAGDYEISYKNIGPDTINSLFIKLTTPLNFKINTILPAASSTQKTTDSEVDNFGPISLNPNAEFKIKISGAFTAQAAGGNKVLTSELFLKSDEQAYSQGAISKNINLSASTIKFNLTANNSPDKQTINFEDQINFALSYENSGQLAMKNAVIRLVLETPSVDSKSLLNWNSVTDANNGAVDGEQRSASVRVGTITWTKKEIKNLSELKPGDKGLINLAIPVKPKKDFDVTHLTNWHVKAYGELTTSQTKDAPVLQSNVLDLALTTDLALATKATVKETKNQTTTYVVNWTLTNHLHEITTVVLKAKLPDNVSWGGLVSVSAGELSFDKDTRQVSWAINRIPISFPKTEISFAVTLKRQSDGQATLLTNKTSIEAKDKVTGESLLISKEPLTVQ